MEEAVVEGSQPKASLLGLPGELRNQIYDHVVDDIDSVKLRPDSRLPLVYTDRERRGTKDFDYVHTTTTSVPASLFTLLPQTIIYPPISYTSDTSYSARAAFRMHPLLHACHLTREEFSSCLSTSDLPTTHVCARVVDFDYSQLLKWVRSHHCEHISIELAGPLTVNQGKNLKEWHTMGIGCRDSAQDPFEIWHPPKARKQYTLSYTTSVAGNAMQLSHQRNILAQLQLAADRHYHYDDFFGLVGRRRFIEDGDHNKIPHACLESAVRRISDHCKNSAEIVQSHILKMVSAEEGEILKQGWAEYRRRLEVLSWSWVMPEHSKKRKRTELSVDEEGWGVYRRRLEKLSYCWVLPEHSNKRMRREPSVDERTKLFEHTYQSVVHGIGALSLEA